RVRPSSGERTPRGRAALGGWPAPPAPRAGCAGQGTLETDTLCRFFLAAAPGPFATAMRSRAGNPPGRTTRRPPRRPLRPVSPAGRPSRRGRPARPGRPGAVPLRKDEGEKRVGRDANAEPKKGPPVAPGTFATR